MKCHQMKIKLDNEDILDSEYIQFQEHKDHIGWVLPLSNYSPPQKKKINIYIWGV